MALRAKPRAEALRPPPATPELKKVQSEQKTHRGALEATERRSVVRGLLVLGVLALGWSIARAGLGRVFVHGWWRQW